MKHFLIVCLSVLIGVGAAAKSVIRHPRYVAWNAEGLSIEKVVTDKHATTLYFRCEGKPGARIWMDSECFLSDAADRRYRAVSAQGIELDSVLVYDRKGRGAFSISFEPLPEDTEVFDFVENLRQCDSFRFYMIHDLKDEAALRDRLPDVPAPMAFSFPTEAFHSDSVIIRGRISGRCADGQLSRLALYNHTLKLCDESYKRTFSPAFTTVRADGSFELRTGTAGPSWVNLNCQGYDGDLIPVFLWPGDTIDIVVEHYGESNQLIRYRSRHCIRYPHSNTFTPNKSLFGGCFI